MWGLKKTTYGLVLLLASVLEVQASAWNPDAWQGEVISGYVLTSADTAIDETGDRVPLQIYTKRILQNYGNLGLTPRIALIGTFDWQDTQIVGQGLDISFSKPSSVSAGLQYQLSRREGHAVAISVSYVDGIDLPSALLTLENRETSVELRGLWGESRSFHGHNVFAEAQLAGQLTLKGDYGSTHAQLTLGGEPTERSMVLLKGRYREFEPGLYERLAIARQRRWEVEASAVYRIRKRDYIEIGYTGIVAGESTVLESGMKIGYWRKF